MLEILELLTQALTVVSALQIFHIFSTIPEISMSIEQSDSQSKAKTQTQNCYEIQLR
jgi:hypothetical protein